MIAQKMVDAKHSQEPGHTPIAWPNLVATASWTPPFEHLGSLLSVWSCRLIARTQHRVIAHAPLDQWSGTNLWWLDLWRGALSTTQFPARSFGLLLRVPDP